jgi:hypothetical protein
MATSVGSCCCRGDSTRLGSFRVGPGERVNAPQRDCNALRASHHNKTVAIRHASLTMNRARVYDLLYSLTVEATVLH